MELRSERPAPHEVVNESGERSMTDRSEPDPVNAPETGGITWVYVADSGVPMARIEQGAASVSSQIR